MYMLITISPWLVEYKVEFSILIAMFQLFKQPAWGWAWARAGCCAPREHHVAGVKCSVQILVVSSMWSINPPDDLCLHGNWWVYKPSPVFDSAHVQTAMGVLVSFHWQRNLSSSHAPRHVTFCISILWDPLGMAQSTPSKVSKRMVWTNR